MEILAGFIVLLLALVGIALTVLTLPGIWLMIAGAVLVNWWRDWGMFSWWTIGVAIALGVIAEIVEFAASAAGAAKVGGTRRGAIGSLIGGLVGAIGGAPFFPPFGPILGGALGAGLGALIGERHDGRMSWGESAKVGGGAAAGRLVATVAKVVLAVVIALVIAIDAFV